MENNICNKKENKTNNIKYKKSRVYDENGDLRDAIFVWDHELESYVLLGEDGVPKRDVVLKTVDGVRRYEGDTHGR
jgi:hypothetical protein